VGADAEIGRVIALYAHLLDDGRVDECAALFADGATLSFWGQVHQGHAALRAVFAQIVEGMGGTGRHLVGTPVIDVDGHTARAWTDFAGTNAGDDGVVIRATGRYYDELECSPDGRWRLSARRVRFTGEDVPAGATPGPAS
jgi:ketosteroid isomerase-like protein